MTHTVVGRGAVRAARGRACGEGGVPHRALVGCLHLQPRGGRRRRPAHRALRGALRGSRELRPAHISRRSGGDRGSTASEGALRSMALGGSPRGGGDPPVHHRSARPRGAYVVVIRRRRSSPRELHRRPRRGARGLDVDRDHHRARAGGGGAPAQRRRRRSTSVARRRNARPHRGVAGAAARRARASRLVRQPRPWVASSRVTTRALESPGGRRTDNVERSCVVVGDRDRSPRARGAHFGVRGKARTDPNRRRTRCCFVESTCFERGRKRERRGDIERRSGGDTCP
jgi:hypothetical protein